MVSRITIQNVPSVIDPASAADSEPAFGRLSSFSPPATVLIVPSTVPIDVGCEVVPNPDPVDALD